MGILSLDVGGTSIKCGFFKDGQLQSSRQLATEKELGAQMLVEKMVGLVQGFPLAKAVGISTAGEVDSEQGRIVLSDNIPGYTGMPLGETLEKRLGLPVCVENDVNAAALGEMYFGAAKGLNDFLMLTYGTGIGGSAILNNRLYKGAGGSAGEFGGIITHPEKMGDSSYATGSYERFASTSALVEAAQKLNPAWNSGQALFSAQNQPQAAALIENWLCEVGYGLISLVHCFNPQAVLLGGGIMEQATLVQRLQQKVVPMLKPSFRQVRLLPALLGNKAGLYGAAYLAEKRLHNG